MNISIAIDGPSGAGKSTIADEVAARLHILHLDTGAMYRAFAWLALQRGLDSLDEAALLRLTEDAKVEVEFAENGQRTFINDTDVTGMIRTPEISMAASNVSKFDGVRRFMVKRQQELAKKCSMVLDGRDIGLTVMPDATLKVFLTASSEERARRRFLELEAKGMPVSYQEVLADVNRRDHQDTTREVEPLRPAEDAIVMDSSHMSREQVVEAILSLLADKEADKEKEGTGSGRAAEETVVKPQESIGFLYHLARVIFYVVFKVLFPIEYHNVEKAQINAPYLLIANHQSLLDPMIVAIPCKRYQIRFFGKKELVKNPFVKVLFNHLGVIAVDRHNMDMAAVRACMKALKEGHSLCIFPEGTRYKQGVMQELESGVAVIALRGKVPLLPAYITEKPRLFHKVHCYYGDPISVDALAEKGNGKENCDALLNSISSTYERLEALYSVQ